jgi:hypothetical protein
MRAFGWVTAQSHRMEGYTALALLVALLGLSHALGYWPHGRAPKSDRAGGLPVTPDLVWRVVLVGSIVAVGVLFVLGQWLSVRRSPVGRAAQPVPTNEPSKLRIQEARYGNPTDGWHDRRREVESQIVGDTLSFLVGPALLRDPLEGKPKELVVLYSYRAELGARINRLLEEKNSAEDELAALKARAERDTHSDPTAPTIGIMIERVVMEPIDSTLGRNYPRKLRIFFRENAGDEIYLGQANWVPGGIHAEQGKRFACQFELGEGGKFTGESPEKLVSPGKRMRLYVGLDSRVPEEEAKRMTEQRLLGTLLIPATARGKNMTLAIKL